VIAKITRGGDGRGLVRYLFGKGDHNEPGVSCRSWRGSYVGSGLTSARRVQAVMGVDHLLLGFDGSDGRGLGR
jgi:hypothetical protein